MDNQQAERMRVLWKSGRDKLRSFFVHLSEVREEIGDDALPAWCMNELGIGLSVIARMTATLSAVDGELAKAELAKATKAEKERRAAERVRQKARKQQGKAMTTCERTSMTNNIIDIEILRDRRILNEIEANQACWEQVHLGMVEVMCQSKLHDISLTSATLRALLDVLEASGLDRRSAKQSIDRSLSAFVEQQVAP
jgi:hypothetical protein